MLRRPATRLELSHDEISNLIQAMEEKRLEEQLRSNRNRNLNAFDDHLKNQELFPRHEIISQAKRREMGMLEFQRSPLDSRQGPTDTLLNSTHPSVNHQQQQRISSESQSETAGNGSLMSGSTLDSIDDNPFYHIENE